MSTSDTCFQKYALTCRIVETTLTLLHYIDALERACGVNPHTYLRFHGNVCDMLDTINTIQSEQGVLQ